MNAGKEFVKEAYRAIFQKDYVKAIEFFKKAIKRDANNSSYYYKLSITYARNNDLKEAIEAIEEALRLRPGDSVYLQQSELLQSRSLAKEALRRLESGEEGKEVIPLLERSIELDPLSIQPRLMYACLLEKQGRKKEAILALKELLTLDPWHREAKELLKKWEFMYE